MVNLAWRRAQSDAATLRCRLGRIIFTKDARLGLARRVRRRHRVRRLDELVRNIDTIRRQSVATTIGGQPTACLCQEFDLVLTMSPASIINCQLMVLRRLFNLETISNGAKIVIVRTSQGAALS